MRTTTAVTILGATAALGAGAAVATGATGQVTGINAATRHVEGRITTINRPSRTFKVRDLQRGSLTVKVTPSTRFDRIAGFPALRVSERVDVRAVRSSGVWRAAKVERARSSSGVHGVRTWGGSDDPAGHDRFDDRGGLRGDDDGPGHDVGDDRGGQHGADDGAGHDVGDDHGGDRGGDHGGHGSH